MKNSVTAFMFVCVCCSSAFLLGADWPQYRGISGDGASNESIGAIDWNSQAPKILWKSPTPLGFSSFCVADGRAFTLIARPNTSGEKVETCIALDAASGKEVWSLPLGKSDYGHDGGNSGAPENRGGDGPRATPASDGKHVFIYDSHMVLTCVDAASGSVVWKHDIINEYSGRVIKWLNATSPLLIDDVIYVGGGGADESFLAFNKNTGDLLWKSGDETITHATPRFANINGSDQVIFFAQSGLVSVSADTGKELWRTEFPFSVSTAASPVVEGNHIYCSAGYGVGAELVQLKDASKPESQWFKRNELMNHWSTPIIRDGYLYGIYEFKKYGKAPLQCVELATGEIKWSERGFGPGNCIIVGDKLVVLSDAGEVVIASANPDGYKELGRTKAIKGKCWSTPAYSNGKIFVRSTEEAACIVVD